MFLILREALGESRELGSIDRERAREAFGLVKGLPKGFGKGKRWDGMSLQEAVTEASREGLPTIAPATVNRVYMGLASTLFGWAEVHGGLRIANFRTPASGTICELVGVPMAMACASPIA